MVDGKIKFALWLTPDAKRKVQEYHTRDFSISRSDFIEKAIHFYCGYLDAQAAEEFLPAVLADTLEGHLNVFADRMAKLLYKQAVELDMVMNIIANDTDIDEPQLQKLRAKSVRDVNRTNGKISFDNALKFQKGTD